MKVGFDVRRGDGEETRMGGTVGGCCLVVGGSPNKTTKLRETGGPLALDGRHVRGETRIKYELALTLRGALERRHDRGITFGRV